MLLELCIILATIVLVVDYCKRKRINDILKASGIPHPKYTLPVLGDIVPVLGMDITDCINFYNRMRERYGKVAYMWSVYTGVLFVQDVKFFEYILSSQRLITKSFFYDMLSSWLGNGLLLSTGSKWHKRRKIITPAFHFKILEQFVEIFEQHGRVMVEKLEAKADGQTVVDIFPVVCVAALDIIADSAMGVKINAQGDSDIPYTKALTSAVHIISDRSMKPLQYSDLGFMLLAPKSYFAFQKDIKVMHAFTEKLICERRSVLMKSIEDGTHESIDNLDDMVGLKKRMTFLDVLLQSTIDGQPLSNEDIREEVDTFAFEGHDTTTSGLSSTLHMLSRHPEIQQRVFEEIMAVVGNDKNRPMRMSDLQELKYLECVIKETLRLYPPVPIIGRVTTEDTQLGNQMIPNNTTVSLSIYAIGHDPEWFDNPEEFRPERFFPENTASANPYAYVPFSAGPRNCIGQKFALLEMKSTICCMLKRFELLPLGPAMKPLVSIVLRSANGVNLGLKRRIY